MPKISARILSVLWTALLLGAYCQQEAHASSGSCQTRTENKFECMEFTGNIPAPLRRICDLGGSQNTKWFDNACPQENVLGFCEVPRNDGIRQRSYCYHMDQLPDRQALEYCKLSCSGSFTSWSAGRRGSPSSEFTRSNTGESAAAQPPRSNQSARARMERNTNRPGEDYKDLDLSSPEPQLCAEACMKDARCRAWTYVSPGVQADNARCWLKDKIPPAVPDDNCVSGLKDSGAALQRDGGEGTVRSSSGSKQQINSQRYPMEWNTNRPGEDYKDLDLSSPEPQLCAEACMKDARCRAWTYVSPGVQADNARCWLKDKIPPAVSDENCVSGTLKR
jgi:hypothetical protein